MVFFYGPFENEDSINYVDNIGTLHIKIGLLHRNKGPAMEWYNGKCWREDGKIHRLDGPAVEYSNGDKEWVLSRLRNKLSISRRI